MYLDVLINSWNACELVLYPARWILAFVFSREDISVRTILSLSSFFSSSLLFFELLTLSQNYNVVDSYLVCLPLILCNNNHNFAWIHFLYLLYCCLFVSFLSKRRDIQGLQGQYGVQWENSILYLIVAPYPFGEFGIGNNSCADMTLIQSLCRISLLIYFCLQLWERKRNKS